MAQTIQSKQTSLKRTFIASVKSGLQRHSLNRCSRWAEQCRIMGQPYPGNWSFEHFPWLREMHDTTADVCIGQKSAQAGYTETMLNRALYAIDILGSSVMYILPTKTPDASDFSASRFDAALELSPYLNDLFSDTKNIGHKRAGGTNLYIRGSRSRAGLKSVPAGILIFDELDEMVQENIPLALERQSGQVIKQTWMLSTPTIPGFGINKRFLESTQESFFFPCPSCGRRIKFTFPDSLVIIGDDPRDPKIKQSHYICTECKQPLPQDKSYLQQGVWVASFPERLVRGFHVNQMYSSTVEPWRIATSYLLAQSNQTEEQELYNSKLGLPKLVEGAKITDEQIEAVIAKHRCGVAASKSRIVTIGIDVGTYLHYIVQEWHESKQFGPDINMNYVPRTVEIGKCLNFWDLDPIMAKYRPNMTVIDANPERRKAFEFAQKYWGSVKLCFYGKKITGKHININKNDLESSITVDRTSWLDVVVGRFQTGRVTLPLDTPLEYKSHLKAMARIYEKDSQGNPVGRYVNEGPDHYMHATNYAEIALQASTLAFDKNIRTMA